MTIPLPRLGYPVARSDHTGDMSKYQIRTDHHWKAAADPQGQEPAISAVAKGDDLRLDKTPEMQQNIWERRLWKQAHDSSVVPPSSALGHPGATGGLDSDQITAGGAIASGRLAVLPRPAEPVSQPSERDLAQNKPGAGLKVKITSMRKESPARYFFSRIFRNQSDEMAWVKGLRGERIVGRQLNRLGRQWRILHSITHGAQGADFDHLVIGPKGVFVVNSKNHSGKVINANAGSFYVDGFKKDYLGIARSDALKAERILSAATGDPIVVTPVIAVLCRDFRDNGARSGAVPVLEATELRQWLKSRSSVLDPARVERLYAIARQEHIWCG